MHTKLQKALVIGAIAMVVVALAMLDARPTTSNAPTPNLCEVETIETGGIGGTMHFVLKCGRDHRKTAQAHVIASYLKNPGPLTCDTSSGAWKIICEPRE